MAKKVVLNEEDFPSNSKVAPVRESRRTIREEGANIEEPTRRPTRMRGQAVIKKKSITQSIASMLLGSSSEVGSYIWEDVLLPAAKDTIQQMITSGIEMLLFGEVRSTKSRDKGTKVSYGSYYKGRRDEEDTRRRRPASRGDKFDLDSIFFRDHNEAEDVLQELCDLMEEYEEVTVADYFDAAGIDGNSWAHTKFGWKERDLRKGYCTHTRNGWAVVLPDPIELD